MKSFRELIAWQKGMDLAVMVYEVTATFPVEERYGLVSQMRRCSVSIPSNIAEGHGRLTNKDWQHFLAEARGSTCELQTQLEIASRVKMGDRESLRATCDAAEEVGRILNGLIASTTNAPTRKLTTSN
jgi:four helix bundle protein